MKPLIALIATVVGFNYLYEYSPGAALMFGLIGVVMIYFWESD